MGEDKRAADHHHDHREAPNMARKGSLRSPVNPSTTTSLKQPDESSPAGTGASPHFIRFNEPIFEDGHSAGHHESGTLRHRTRTHYNCVVKAPMHIAPIDRLSSNAGPRASQSMKMVTSFRLDIGSPTDRDRGGLSSGHSMHLDAPSHHRAGFSGHLSPEPEATSEGTCTDVDEEVEKEIVLDPNVKATPMHERKDFKWLIIGGCLLTLIAGFVNAVVFLETSVKPTHATGVTTAAAAHLAKGQFTQMGNMFCLIGPFLAGSTLASTAVGSDKFVMGHRYGIILVLVGLFYMGGTVFMREYHNKWVAIAFYAAGAGMQNSLCTSFSGAVIRTTHVTGMLTDIGMVLGHIIRSDVLRIDEQATSDRWKLQVLIPQILSFFLGGLLGTLAQEDMGADAAFVGAGTMAALGILYVLLSWRGFFDGFLEEEIIENEIEQVKAQFTEALQAAVAETAHQQDLDNLENSRVEHQDETPAYHPMHSIRTISVRNVSAALDHSPHHPRTPASPADA